MTQDYELIPAIAELVLHRFSNGELGLAFPEVLTAVEVCAANSIAVPGVDLLESFRKGSAQGGCRIIDWLEEVPGTRPHME